MGVRLAGLHRQPMPDTVDPMSTTHLSSMADEHAPELIERNGPFWAVSGDERRHVLIAP
ncbi:MAG: hypothetical protein QM713_13880 [Arachnia sp.]